MRSSQTTYVEIKGTILKETANAILLKFTDDKVFENRSAWWPISQTGSIHRETEGARIKVSEWIYNRKLEEFGIEAPEPETPIDEDGLF